MLKNPGIYALFVKFTMLTIKAGKKHFGAKAIMERVRWETMEQGKGMFKINNNYTAYYARLFEEKNPEHKGYFLKRKATRYDK